MLSCGAYLTSTPWLEVCMPHCQKQATAGEQVTGNILGVAEVEAASMQPQAEGISPSLDELSDEFLLHALAGGSRVGHGTPLPTLSSSPLLGRLSDGRRPSGGRKSVA